MSAATRIIVLPAKDCSHPNPALGKAGRPSSKAPVWLFDLDDTFHDASHAAFGAMHVADRGYIASTWAFGRGGRSALRRRYWRRYGATLLGMVRHHGVRAAHFLEETHRMPGLEARLRTSAHDRAALKRLPGRKVILTNAPRAYAMRVLGALVPDRGCSTR